MTLPYGEEYKTVFLILPQSAKENKPPRVGRLES